MNDVSTASGSVSRPPQNPNEETVSARAPDPRLTKCELRVCQLLSEGRSNKEIAAMIGRSYRTVKAQIRYASWRVGLPTANRAKLLAACYQLGLVDGSGRRPIPPELTRGEKRIVDLLLSGLRFREIGQRVGRTEQGVRNVSREVYDKCGVWSRTELVSRYIGGNN